MPDGEPMPPSWGVQREPWGAWVPTGSHEAANLLGPTIFPSTLSYPLAGTLCKLRNQTSKIEKKKKKCSLLKPILLVAGAPETSSSIIKHRKSEKTKNQLFEKFVSFSILYFSTYSGWLL